MFNKIKAWFLLKIMSMKFAIKINNVNRTVKSPSVKSIIYHKIFKKINEIIETGNYDSANYFIDGQPVWVDYFDHDKWEFVGLICPGIVKIGVVSPLIISIKRSFMDEDGEGFGYLIILPTSFKTNDEFEKFVIYHEIGHIAFETYETIEIEKCVCAHDIEKEFFANNYACIKLMLDISVAEEYIRRMGELILIDTTMLIGTHNGKKLKEYLDYIQLLLINNKSINEEINDIRNLYC